MGQQTLGGTDITALRERYARLVDERLPAAARDAGDWPITEDHCFARVVLDTTFGDEWYGHVDGRPAVEHLSPVDLERAIAVAERMLAEGRALVAELNARSLRWRGEL